MHDFKFAFRQLLKTPAFTFAAVLTLALAIGVNSAIFALVHRLVLKPTIAKDPASVVGIYTARKGENAGYRQFSYAEFEALRQAPEVFSDVCSLGFSLAGIGVDAETARRSFALFVSDNYFQLFEGSLPLGRAFTAAESKPGADIPVMVISHDYWKRLGRKEAVIGSSLRVNGEAFTVVGVAPHGFSGGHALLAPDAWFPLGVFARIGASQFSDQASTDLANPRVFSLNLIGRLAPGVTRDAAKGLLAVLDQRINALAPPDSGPPRELQVHQISRFNISTEPDSGAEFNVMGSVLLGLAAVVLLIASLNLANMLLARGATRRKEIALRLALGAGRGRVIRQLFVEGLLLAVLGGMGGLALSYWANSLLLGTMSGLFESMSFSIILDFRPDATVLAATFGFCLVATILFSLGPAVNLTRVDLANDLKQTAGEFAAARGGLSSGFFAPRHLLVMAQIALSLALVFCAALFFRGGAIAATLDPGFNTKGALVAEIDYSLIRVKAADALPRFVRLRDRVLEMPGVKGAAVSSLAPYNNNTDTRRLLKAGEAVDAPLKAGEQRGASGVYHAITHGYFLTLGMPLLEGRDFTAAETDQPGPPRVIVIDDKLAKRLFPDGGALGQRVKYSTADPDGKRPEMEIVGIVRNHRHEVLGTESHAHIFVPLAQAPESSAFLHIRLANEDPAAASAFLPSLRRLFRSFDADLPLLRASTLAELVDRNIGNWVVRMGAALFGAFGLVALLIAAVGVYGVHSYAVSRRTREIGIRMSLGAQPGDVFQLIMGQGARQTGFALAIGLLLSLGVGQLVTSLLYRVSPYDTIALTGSIVTLGTAALIACFLPARRATRVNPMTALRAD